MTDVRHLMGTATITCVCGPRYHHDKSLVEMQIDDEHPAECVACGRVYSVKVEIVVSEPTRGHEMKVSA